MEKNTIFVSIACFMDEDIVNTIDDCLNKAKYPEKICFGVCLQYDPEDNFFSKYDNHPQVKMKRMHWKEARGPTFARYYCTKTTQTQVRHNSVFKVKSAQPTLPI